MNKKNLWQKNIVLMICIITLLGIFPLVSPTCQNINNEQYDFIIISPANFSEDLVPLIDHKEQHSISTKIITLDEIYQGNYFPANGRDDAEQIKYFLKDAKENWNINYVMLVGGKEELPGRYVDICSWGEHYKCFSDLYYADIYDENGSFCSWDSNNDNVFAGQSMEGMVDEVDLSPDVAIGRLLCQDPSEVQIVVEKIINYEKTAYDEQWFRNLILCGGDEPSNGPSEGDKYEEWFNRTANTTWEGEYLGDKVAEIMKGFTAKKIYATGLFRSDINFLNVNNINNAINEGAGFLLFVGHGRQDRAIKTNFPLLKSIWLPFPSGYYTSHSKKLSNGERLPVTIFAGCYCADFDTINSPIAWEFVKNENGGAIASFGATTGSQMISSTLVTDTYMGLLILDTFRFYLEGITTIGDIWRSIIIAYIGNEDAWSLGDDYSVFNWWHNNVNPMVLEEWMLIGDPTLRIGGYP